MLMTPSILGNTKIVVSADLRWEDRLNSVGSDIDDSVRVVDN